jgi:hypothetical protein
MKVINLTPHEICEATTGQTFPPSGGIARVSSSQVKIKEINGIPFYRTEFHEIEGLPDPEPDTMYIVSGMIFDRCSRTDVIAPGNLVRDNKGQPIGCQGFRIK